MKKSKVSHVFVDKIQIQQVLVNLMRNAIEAMQNSVRRELAVSTHPAVGNMVVVRVSDTGSGIDPDVVPKLFQPFVTTSDKARGLDCRFPVPLSKRMAARSRSDQTSARERRSALRCEA